ncbi:MAG TPA: DUF3568 family protein [Gemmatimonadaceae bacterium]|nr:DUF3568 family protein [Gemmatimonadaceae bacterium]
MRRALWVLLVLGAGALSSGCFLFAAGAGAAGAIAWTNRGAESVVEGSVDKVFERSTGVFGDMGITRTGDTNEDSGAKRTLTGTKGDLEVTVEMNRESATTTKVEVYARRSAVDWDKNYARDVLNRIIKRG